MKQFFQCALPLFIFIFTGCASDHYSFISSSPDNLSSKGVPGTLFFVTKGEEGKENSSVRILPMGIQNLEGRSVLQVRYYFENYEGKPWHLDAKLQKVKFRGEDQTVIGELHSLTSAGTESDISSGYSRVLDFYFDLPASVREEANLDGLELIWNVKTVHKEIKGSAIFTRVKVEENAPAQSKSKGGKGRH